MKYLFSALFLAFTGAQVPAQTPSPAQLRWHDTEFYLFFHFGPNTFTNLEWGYGTEPEAIFNPGDLDCDQWCRVAKAAGARGVILTAKHHDGFCLFPSAYSAHTVRESPWKAGKGDVVGELAQACRKHGLKLGLYLSPWDRNHPKYGTPEYNDVYVATLTELLTRYGKLFEIWWDGANGEGPNGKKQMYDFRRFEKTAAALQPDAVIFSDVGPGCRWAGNERGLIESDINWCLLDTAGFGRGATGPPTDTLNRGNENGRHWIPAECDVSIRPGWFYHPEEDDKVKNPVQLFDIYLNSVGRGANLILNVPPDRRGRIAANDSISLTIFGEKLRAAFAQNLALGKKIAYSGKGASERFSRKLTDGNRKSAVTPGEAGSSITLDLEETTGFDCVLLREHIAKGQHIKQFKVEIRENNQWREVAAGGTIGPRRILTFPTVSARLIRVSIMDSKGPCALSEVEVYRSRQ
ncbi:MAG: alpha-L-fucosidase [Saprospiraceae bacterium]|jgi:alpha-L-fucosidase|nr:alpha-L-fucosidase [Saprospiraceae bacterium]